VTGPDAVVVLVTGPDVESLRAMAVRLVDERLAACVNLIPGMTSVYRWEEQVREDDEVLAVVKTTRPTLEALRARILELHPYDVPEFLALPVEAGGTAYLAWIDECVALGSQSQGTDEQT
jgi:periplasmic divalent cation tolerance protein